MIHIFIDVVFGIPILVLILNVLIHFLPQPKMGEAEQRRIASLNLKSLTQKEKEELARNYLLGQKWGGIITNPWGQEKTNCQESSLSEAYSDRYRRGYLKASRSKDYRKT